MSVCIEYVRLEAIAAWGNRKRSEVLRDPEQAYELFEANEKHALLPEQEEVDEGCDY